jgi:CO dehydrogenase/acetyl-CoA synthase beta subunit
MKKAGRGKRIRQRARPAITLATNHIPSAPFAGEQFKGDGGYGHRVNWFPGMTRRRMQRYIDNTIWAHEYADQQYDALQKRRFERTRMARAVDGLIQEQKERREAREAEYQQSQREAEERKKARLSGSGK